MSYGIDEKGLLKFKLQPYEWFEKQYPELAKWIADTSTYLTAESVCEIKDYGSSVGVNLFSDQRIYHISANKEGNYLGLTFSMRDSGAGNDKTDGSYSKETWDQIVRDMLSCELISLDRRDNPSHED